MFDARYAVTPNFFDEAPALRTSFDAFVTNPDSQNVRKHGKWNYWYVPELYAYLRADPKAVLCVAEFERFAERLADWAFDKYGLTRVTGPSLSMYVSGCEQQPHNDAANGDFGYVYSLTRWGERRFAGGETLLFADNVSSVRGRSGAGANFFDKIPPVFNQLLIFDDRLLHGVARVSGGAMDPLDSRVVLHGHLRASDVVVTAVDDDETRARVGDCLVKVMADLASVERVAAQDLQGVLTLRLVLAPDGSPSELRPLLARVLRHTGESASIEGLLAEIRTRLFLTRFPSGAGGAEITIPVVLNPQ
jgi:hypothetical protein